jgi:hypothetical protein
MPVNIGAQFVCRGVCCGRYRGLLNRDLTSHETRRAMRIAKSGKIAVSDSSNGL